MNSGGSCRVECRFTALLTPAWSMRDLIIKAEYHLSSPFRAAVPDR